MKANLAGAGSQLPVLGVCLALFPTQDNQRPQRGEEALPRCQDLLGARGRLSVVPGGMGNARLECVSNGFLAEVGEALRIGGSGWLMSGVTKN